MMPVTQDPIYLDEMDGTDWDKYVGGRFAEFREGTDATLEKE
jgi:hypothetical protein